jgi:hypothetical protein
MSDIAKVMAESAAGLSALIAAGGRARFTSVRLGREVP